MTAETLPRVGIAERLSGLVAGRSPLTAFNALVPADRAARPGRDIAYGALPRQKLDIYAPADATGSEPVLVFLYGGGWYSGRRQDYGFVGKALASRGFLTVIPDYRLVPEVHYPSFVQDGALALRWVQDHAAQFGGDPRRVVMAGHSAGAYNAMMLALDRGFAAAAGFDPSAIRAVVGVAGPYKFLPLRASATINAFSAAPDLPATQPVNHARPDAPAVLLLHGEKDSVVYPKNSVAMADALTAAGGRAEVKIYPGLNHIDPMMALARPFRRKAPVLEDMAGFLMEQSAS